MFFEALWIHDGSIILLLWYKTISKGSVSNTVWSHGVKNCNKGGKLMPVKVDLCSLHTQKFQLWFPTNLVAHRFKPNKFVVSSVFN